MTPEEINSSDTNYVAGGLNPHAKLKIYTNIRVKSEVQDTRDVETDEHTSVINHEMKRQLIRQEMERAAAQDLLEKHLIYFTKVKHPSADFNVFECKRCNIQLRISSSSSTKPVIDQMRKHLIKVSREREQRDGCWCHKLSHFRFVASQPGKFTPLRLNQIYRFSRFLTNMKKTFLLKLKETTKTAWLC